MILSIFKMNNIGTYAYFQLEVLYLYQIYHDFLASLYHFPMLAPLQYWNRLKGQSLLCPFLYVLSAGLLLN